MKIQNMYEFRVFRIFYASSPTFKNFIITIALPQQYTNVRTCCSDLWVIPHFLTFYKLQSLKYNLPLMLNKYKDIAKPTLALLRQLFFFNHTYNYYRKAIYIRNSFFLTEAKSSCVYLYFTSVLECNIFSWCIICVRVYAYANSYMYVYICVFFPPFFIMFDFFIFFHLYINLFFFIYSNISSIVFWK